MADAIIATLREQLRPATDCRIRVAADDSLDVVQALQLFLGDLSDDLNDADEQKLRNFLFSPEFLGPPDAPNPAVDVREVLLALTSYAGGRQAPLVVEMLFHALRVLSVKEFAKDVQAGAARAAAWAAAAAPPPALHPTVLSRWMPTVAAAVVPMLVGTFVQRDGAEEFVATANGAERGGNTHSSPHGCCGHHHHDHHHDAARAVDAHTGDDQEDADEDDDDDAAGSVDTTLRAPVWIAEHWYRFAFRSLLPFLRAVHTTVDREISERDARGVGAKVIDLHLQLLLAVCSADLTAAQLRTTDADSAMPPPLSLFSSVDAIMEAHRTEKVEQMRKRGVPSRAMPKPLGSHEYSESSGGSFAFDAPQRAAFRLELAGLVSEALRGHIAVHHYQQQQQQQLKGGDAGVAAPILVTPEAAGMHLLLHCARRQRMREFWLTPLGELSGAVDDLADQSERATPQQRIAHRMEMLRRRHDAIDAATLVADTGEESEWGHLTESHAFDEGGREESVAERAYHAASEQWPLLGVFAAAYRLLELTLAEERRERMACDLAGTSGAPYIARIPMSLDHAALFHFLAPLLAQPLRCTSLNAKAAALTLLHFLRSRLRRASLTLHRDEAELAEVRGDVAAERGNESDDELDDLTAARAREEALELELVKLKSGARDTSDLLASYSTPQFNVYFTLLQDIVNVCAVCPALQLRALASCVLSELLELFEGPVRFKMMTSLMKLAPYPSIAATVLMAIKEEVTREYDGIKRGNVQCAGSGATYVPSTDFVNSNLLVMFRMACKEWLKMARLLQQETYFEPLVTAINTLRQMIFHDSQTIAATGTATPAAADLVGQLFRFTEARNRVAISEKEARVQPSNKRRRTANGELRAFLGEVIDPIEELLKVDGEGNISVSPITMFSLRSACDGLRKMLA